MTSLHAHRPRAPARREPRRPGGQRHALGGRRRAVILASVLAGLLGLAALPRIIGTMFASGGPTVPTELLGTWTTSASRYADRGFTISATSLSLDLGPDGVRVHPITRVAASTRGGASWYELGYGDGGQSLTFAFSFSAAGGGAIRLSGPQQVEWRRTSSP